MEYIKYLMLFFIIYGMVATFFWFNNMDMVRALQQDFLECQRKLENCEDDSIIYLE